MTDAPFSGNAPAIQEIISRADAKARGLIHYYTGIACKNGHIAKLYTTNAKCTVCASEKSKASYRRNAEAVCKRLRDARAQNPEAVRAAENAYREGRREHYRALAKARHDKNIDHYRKLSAERYARSNGAYHQKTKEWQRANPEKQRTMYRNKKLRRRGAEGKHTNSDIQNIKAQQKNKCAYCRVNLKSDYHVDHIIALSRGGTNWPKNLQLLCPPCNMSKSAKDPIEFAQSKGFLV